MSIIDTSPIRYVTNQAGETTDVLIPLATWQQWLNSWQEARRLLANQLNGASWLADHEALWQSLAPDEANPISSKWVTEIETRCQEIDSQVVTLMPVEEGLAQLRQKFLP
jgi:hypothetical protein